MKITEYLETILYPKFLPAFWAKKSFMDLSEIDKKYHTMIESLKAWDFVTPPCITFVSKNNGVGKTHLAVCLYKKFVEKNITDYIKTNSDLSRLDKMNHKYFYDETDIYSEIKESFNNNFLSETEIFNKFIKMKFLVIDDLFANRDNEFTRTTMLRIINKRIDWERLPTVITTNLDINEIAQIDTRIASRLCNGYIFNLNEVTTDFRQQIKKKGVTK